MNRVTRVNKMTRVHEYFEITALGLDEKWIEVYVKVEHFDWPRCQPLDFKQPSTAQAQSGPRLKLAAASL